MSSVRSKSVKSLTKRSQKEHSLFIDPQLLTKRKVIINTSTSKQMYKFGTSKRFHSFKKPYDAFFYNLPSVRDTFTTTFGIGNKSDFTKDVMKNKSHNYYNIPREFELFRKNTPQYSFGKGRDVCKKPEYKIEKNTPGVGTYNLRKNFGSDALKFSIFGRDWSNKNFSSSHFVTPGPGAYEETLKTNTLGNYISSNYTNTWKINFGEGGERFKTKNNGVPAPGLYETKTMFNKTGLLFTSKFNSNMAKSMGDRPNCFYAGFKKNDSPGPGSYDVFSDFNGFTNKYKKCKCGRNIGHSEECFYNNEKNDVYLKTTSSMSKSSKNSRKNSKKNSKKNRNDKNNLRYQITC